MSDVRVAAVVVLAAGEGTRMNSRRTPKVLHELLGRTMLGHVVAADRGLDPQHLVVVVGHAREQVAQHLAALDPGVTTVVQEQQLGTGHALQVALDALPDLGGTVVVVPGDAPLLTSRTLGELVAVHEQTGAAATVLSADLDDATGYGRVVRDVNGGVVAIVEDKDADADQLALTEVNSGVYAFDAARLRKALGQLTTDNAQGELYLTDVIALHRGAGLTVSAHVAAASQEVMGVNDRVQLSQARALLRDRVNDAHQRAGVTIVDPATTWIDVTVTLEPDVTIHPGCQLHGATTVATGAVVGPDTTLVDTTVGADSTVLRAHCVGAAIGESASVGPYTYLRPGTVLGNASKAGGFVEIKASTVGAGSKVPHLSYVGDAVIGTR
ncbi:MAG: bifunctional UDP-N-acetylglucosamine diphosphorylase/glucosamine-1-phosphate N-acetyltransferase GlmU, partial [Frankiales bacterium]|nr:bifunctional UDP-N-acetylglucosamine diphosphorylase/glucosamine-1-phosphate N-acetyltransferase GlmU [Frankiales bacterium]